MPRRTGSSNIRWEPLRNLGTRPEPAECAFGLQQDAQVIQHSGRSCKECEGPRAPELLKEHPVTAEAPSRSLFRDPCFGCVLGREFWRCNWSGLPPAPLPIRLARAPPSPHQPGPGIHEAPSSVLPRGHSRVKSDLPLHPKLPGLSFANADSPLPATRLVAEEIAPQPFELTPFPWFPHPQRPCLNSASHPSISPVFPCPTIETLRRIDQASGSETEIGADGDNHPCFNVCSAFRTRGRWSAARIWSDPTRLHRPVWDLGRIPLPLQALISSPVKGDNNTIFPGLFRGPTPDLPWSTVTAHTVLHSASGATGFPGEERPDAEERTDWLRGRWAER
uniref:uncharacterized protein LOC132692919 n=1 Tax=Panthera onca TaxID=9690 RepID=UPI00295449C1|nr:uncharacterized protein LOC132692919 [Panthera onca]